MQDLTIFNISPNITFHDKEKQNAKSSKKDKKVTNLIFLSIYFIENTI